ncbi:MAG TPA: hypothetical protein VFQ31_03650, partial [Methyloceanibacter sp.]|nr:hypothetical protein [Methyloceanibacter sp.]
MTFAALLAEAAEMIDEIVAEGRNELVRRARAKHATQDEVELLLAAHDELQRVWREHELEGLCAELIDGP